MELKMFSCGCGCPEGKCICTEKKYLAFLRKPLRAIPKLDGVKILSYSYPLLEFSTKKCFIKEFGALLGKSLGG